MVTQAEDLKLFSPDVQRDPYPTYKRLRDEFPVYRDPSSKNWALSRFADVYAALGNQELFSSKDIQLAFSRATEVQRGPQPEELKTNPLPLLMDDPPHHSHLRRIVNRPLRRQEVALMEPMIKQTVAELVAPIGDEPVDVMSALAGPLPVMLIASVLGMRVADWAKYKAWTDTGTQLRSTSEERIAAHRAEVSYYASLFAERRGEPRKDMISILIGETSEDGTPYTDQELLDLCRLLLVAGNETTTNLIGNMLNVLADRPELWRQLRKDRSLVEPTVEETLRYESPIQMLWRRMTRDVELHGVAIPRDGLVAMMYASANRDEREFPEPDAFRLDRDLTKHVAFGHGIHFCLGQPLARTDARILLNALLDKFSAVERAGPPTRVGMNHTVRGWFTLPLKFVS